MFFKDIKVIGFDLDYTLYSPCDEMQGKIKSGIYEKIAAEFNIHVDAARDLFEKNYNGNYHWSKSGSRTIEELGRRAGKKLNGRDIVQQSIEEADILDYINPNPELVGMLKRLDIRFHLDLITGTRRDLALAKLKRLGMQRELFGYVFSGGEYGSKTLGDVFKYWLEQRKVSSEQALYVGDNEKQDIDVPKILGIRTCMVGKEYVNADCSIRNVLELEDLLK